MSLFKEFLNKLNEDEGGADSSGDVSYSQDEIAVNDDETSTNTSNNIAGWTPPIVTGKQIGRAHV